MSHLKSYLTLLTGYMRVNWRSSLEYRANFVFELLLSAIEVGMYLFYWKLFFSMAGGIPGATYEQLVALVAFNHVIYAGAETLLGRNLWEASFTIISGHLDVFLAQPKSVLFQLFMSGANPFGLVQIFNGTIVYFLVVPPTLGSIAMYLFGLVVGSLIFASWIVMIHTLTFRIGNSVVVLKLTSVILHFAKKPAKIFSFGVRFVLYTVVPAAYLGSIQSDQAFQPDAWMLLLLAALAVVSPLLASFVFRLGLKKYESGNLIGVRM